MNRFLLGETARPLDGIKVAFNVRSSQAQKAALHRISLITAADLAMLLLYLA